MDVGLHEARHDQCAADRLHVLAASDRARRDGRDPAVHGCRCRPAGPDRLASARVAQHEVEGHDALLRGFEAAEVGGFQRGVLAQRRGRIGADDAARFQHIAAVGDLAGPGPPSGRPAGW